MIRDVKTPRTSTSFMVSQVLMIRTIIRSVVARGGAGEGESREQLWKEEARRGGLLLLTRKWADPISNSDMVTDVMMPSMVTEAVHGKSHPLTAATQTWVLVCHNSGHLLQARPWWF